jgi:hypothetical protein
MSNRECTSLQNAEDGDFVALAESYGFEVANKLPSKYGGFLIREPNGSAWLFGRFDYQDFGRTMTNGQWTALNVAVMRQERVFES